MSAFASAPRARPSIDSDYAVSTASECTLVTAVSDDPTPQRRWCNFLYSTRCPFCSDSDASVEPCKFMHVDTYANMATEERLDMVMPNLMTRHMRNLTREMTRIVDNQARRTVNAWTVVKAWGASGEAGAAANPYLETVLALRQLGWVIPERHASSWSKLEDAPYAQDVAAVLGVVAASVHYNVMSSTEIMFQTLVWIFGEEAPVLNSPELEGVCDLMGVLDEEVKEEAKDDDMPELLQSMSCLKLAPAPAFDMKSPFAQVDAALAQPVSRKERRALIFTQMKQQKALKQEMNRAARAAAAAACPVES